MCYLVHNDGKKKNRQYVKRIQLNILSDTIRPATRRDGHESLFALMLYVPKNVEEFKELTERIVASTALFFYILLVRI